MVLHHNVDRLVGWLLPSSDPPAPHSLLPAARWRRERGKREGVQRANIVWGGVGLLVHCAVYTGDVLKIPNVFWSQCVCTVVYTVQYTLQLFQEPGISEKW